MLEKLQGMFWTSEDEMAAAIRECGCDVLDLDHEVVVVDVDDEEVVLNLVRVNSTIAIQF